MPTADDYRLLYDCGVRLVLNMRFSRRLPAGMVQPPIEVLWLPSFDNPLLPIPLAHLMRGTRAALQVIQSGGSIYAHCAHGRHRSVAMGAAILIAQGYTPEEAMQLIKQKRPQADPEVFYIKQRILSFARRWQQEVSK